MSEMQERLVGYIADRIVLNDDGCWLWTKHISPDGYGVCGTGGTRNAHRLTYMVYRGDLSDDVEIDHLCHTNDALCSGGITCLHRRCVNPEHLEAVTHQENAVRGRNHHLVKTHCPQGHPLSGENLYRRRNGHRGCKTCLREQTRAWRLRKAAS